MKSRIKKAAKVVIKEAPETKKIDVPAKKSSDKEFKKAAKTMASLTQRRTTILTNDHKPLQSYLAN